MTIAQAEKFYEQDTKKYELLNNKELLTWLKESSEKGYHSYIDCKDLQELINNLVYWYEMKYPEREIKLSEGIKNLDFENIEKLSKMMTINQLMYRLPHKQLSLMKCDYRSNGGGIRDIYNDKGEVVGQKKILFMSIYKKDNEYSPFSICKEYSYFLLYADTDNGKVNIDDDLKEYINTDNITLDELLALFKEKYNNKLDFKKLEECIFDHNCDVELRRRVLQLVALKLLYSNRTIPERGYKRATRFINEFNKKMGLNLSTEEIDEIINRDYTNDERNLKSYDEDISKESNLNKPKRLIKK